MSVRGRRPASTHTHTVAYFGWMLAIVFPLSAAWVVLRASPFPSGDLLGAALVSLPFIGAGALVVHFYRRRYLLDPAYVQIGALLLMSPAILTGIIGLDLGWEGLREGVTRFDVAYGLAVMGAGVLVLVFGRRAAQGGSR